jgi:hypothetical protein
VKKIVKSVCFDLDLSQDGEEYVFGIAIDSEIELDLVENELPLYKAFETIQYQNGQHQISLDEPVELWLLPNE